MTSDEMKAALRSGVIGSDSGAKLEHAAADYIDDLEAKVARLESRDITGMQCDIERYEEALRRIVDSGAYPEAVIASEALGLA